MFREAWIEEAHGAPSHISKTVRSIVKIGPPEELQLPVRIPGKGSKSPQPHLEDGSTYRALRPTVLDSNQDLL